MPIVTVAVSAHNILTGRKAHGSNCVVALAIQALVSDHVRVFVNGSVVVFDGESTPAWFRSFPLPAEVGEWVSLYDAGYNVKPFDFQLDIPARWLRMDPPPAWAMRAAEEHEALQEVG